MRAGRGGLNRSCTSRHTGTVQASLYIQQRLLPVYWIVEVTSVKAILKTLTILLLGIAAIRFYPDFSRYMRIRSM